MQVLEKEVTIFKEKLCNLEKRLNEVEELGDAISKLYNELAKMNTSLQVLVTEFNNTKLITLENQDNLKKIFEKPLTEYSSIKTGIVIGCVVFII